MKKLMFGLLLFLGNPLLYAADTFPPPFTAEYTLYAKGFPMGDGTRSLIHLPGGQFIFESIGETSGLVSFFKKIRLEERTEFTQTNGKIRPLKYTYRQTGHKPRLNIVSFDWDNQLAKNTFKGEVKEIPLEEGTLDSLLYQVALMQELKQGKRQLEYKVARKGKISVYKPKLVGTELIETGMGQLETLKYEHLSSNQKRRTILWCAPKLHYLPVQVQHIESDGDVFSMILESVKGL
ncbi:conserved hypothetical protein, secreted [Beggiatoa sp. PS]|nr:conserved hypothetical protein, secreted [Beggiatoa sp. PS]